MRHPVTMTTIVLMASAAAAADEPIVLLDQIGYLYDPEVTSRWVASQRFGPDHEAYDVAAIENFTVGPSRVSVCEVAVAAGTQSSDLLEDTTYSVEIYSSPESAERDLVGDVASVAFETPDFVTIPWHEEAVLQFSVDIDLEAGTEYWLAVIANRDSGHQVWIFLSERGDDESYLANPGGGFGFTLASVADLTTGTATGVAYRVLAGTCPPPCEGAFFGDVDRDGWTQWSDLLLVLSNWSPDSGCGFSCSDPGDANCDGFIDIEDLMRVVEHWNPSP